MRSAGGRKREPVQQSSSNWRRILSLGLSGLDPQKNVYIYIYIYTYNVCKYIYIYIHRSVCIDFFNIYIYALMIYVWLIRLCFKWLWDIISSTSDGFALGLKQSRITRLLSF